MLDVGSTHDSLVERGESGALFDILDDRLACYELDTVTGDPSSQEIIINYTFSESS